MDETIIESISYSSPVQYTIISTALKGQIYHVFSHKIRKPFLHLSTIIVLSVAQHLFPSQLSTASRQNNKKAALITLKDATKSRESVWGCFIMFGCSDTSKRRWLAIGLNNNSTVR